jgi:hypothetical protein
MHDLFHSGNDKEQLENKWEKLFDCFGGRPPAYGFSYPSSMEIRNIEFSSHRHNVATIQVNAHRDAARYGNRFQNEIANVYYKWTFLPRQAAQYEAAQWKASSRRSSGPYRSRQESGYFSGSGWIVDKSAGVKPKQPGRSFVAGPPPSYFPRFKGFARPTSNALACPKAGALESSSAFLWSASNAKPESYI